MVTCTVDAKCKGEAVLQALADCAGCEATVAEHAADLESKRAEHAKYEQALDVVRQGLADRADAGEDAQLSAVEEVAVRLAMDKIRELGATIETLTAAHAALNAEHTHPVFACAKHKSKLPGA